MLITPSSPSAARAAATARSSPTSRMVAPSSWAWSWSRSRWIVGDGRRRRDRRNRPCRPVGRGGDRRRSGGGRSRHRAGGADPSTARRCRRRRPRRLPRAVASPPGGRRPTRRRPRRSRRSPASAHGHPARSARSVTNPSCSTSSTRLRRAVRCVSRYHTRRHRLASSWPSQASRPYTLTDSGPSWSDPENSTTPLGCIAAGTRSSTVTPRPSNARRIRDAVGRPPGEPTARWTVAAASSPAAIAATLARGRRRTEEQRCRHLSGDDPSPEVPERTAEVR